MAASVQSGPDLGPRSLPSEICVMRHSERVDHSFKNWIGLSNKQGRYTPYDKNMPASLPIDRPLPDYSLDTPITRNGLVLAEMVGLHLRQRVADVIYVNPSLRCLQTAHAVKRMSGSVARLRIEPALLENPHAYRTCPPLATATQRAQFDVDEDYAPMLTLEQLFAPSEKAKEYYERIKEVLQTIAGRSEPSPVSAKPLTVLIVGHATTVFRAAGMLRAEPRKPSLYDLQRVGYRVSYCGSILFRRQASHWQPLPEAIPTVVFGNLSTRIVFDRLYGASD